MAADSAWRLGNNLLGAAITLLAVTFLWPHATQRRPGTAAPSGEPHP